MRSPATSARDGEHRGRDHELVEQSSSPSETLLSALALMTMRGRRPGRRGADHHEVAEHLARIGRRRRHAEGDHDAEERQREAGPLRQVEVIAGQEPARADDDEERRQIDEEHGARRRGPGEAADRSAGTRTRTARRRRARATNVPSRSNSCMPRAAPRRQPAPSRSRSVPPTG